MSILVAFCTLNSICYGQSDINNIRNQYGEINDLIEQCRNKEVCALYQNTLEINSGNGSWRAVGTYSKNVTFWYNDDPDLCDECGENGIGVLRKIEIEEWSGVYKSSYEFLFSKGELIFYYLKNSDEYRYYFKNTMLIRYQENSLIISIDGIENSTVERIQKQGGTLQQLFLLSLQ